MKSEILSLAISHEIILLQMKTALFVQHWNLRMLTAPKVRVSSPSCSLGSSVFKPPLTNKKSVNILIFQNKWSHKAGIQVKHRNLVAQFYRNINIMSISQTTQPSRGAWYMQPWNDENRYWNYGGTLCHACDFLLTHLLLILSSHPSHPTDLSRFFSNTILSSGFSTSESLPVLDTTKKPKVAAIGTTPL